MLRKIVRRLRDRTPAQTFGRIYRSGRWGGAPGDFHSGYGSHLPELVEPYVAAVSRHLRALPEPPTVVDVGCGDFAVAARLVDTARAWIGCDVVPALIERNRRCFARPGVTFVLLDALVDPLPAGDVVVVRHVLQHLSNAHVATIVAKLGGHRRWIVTEHVPAGHFVPNRDKPTDGQTRLPIGSGIVLTAAPFEVAPADAQVLCEVPAEGGIIRTIAYDFGPGLSISPVPVRPC